MSSDLMLDVFNNASFPDLTSTISYDPRFATLNSSRCHNEKSILERVNKEKAGLLAPAIFYSVLLMIIGIVGNPVAIYIYGWRWQNTTTRIFLLWLACLDLLNCVVIMPTEIYVLSSFYYFPNEGLCRMSRFFTYSINNSTSAIFLTIAYDRYIRICHPHRPAMTLFESKVACLVSLFIGFGVSWPALLLYGRKIVPFRSKNGCIVIGTMCNIRNEMDDTPYPLAFFIFLWGAASVCVVVLACFYILIGRVIQKRRRQMKLKKKESLKMTQVGKSSIPPPLPGSLSETGIDEAGTQTRDSFSRVQITVELKNGDKPYTLAHGRANSDCGVDTTCADLSNFRLSGRRIRPPKSTLMLFAITAVFIISFLPFLIVTIIRQKIGPTFYPSLSPVQQVVVNIFLRFYLLNNCTNPIVYGLCNSQFRRELKKMFRVPLLRRESSLSCGESVRELNGGSPIDKQLQ